MSQQQARRTLLVVEDDDDVRALLVAHGRAAGWDVREAASGAEGFAAALRDQPAVVSLDILLPDIDGRQLLRALRNHPRTQNCAILINSVLDLEDILATLLALRVDGVLPKPFVRNDVETLLASVASRML